MPLRATGLSRPTLTAWVASTVSDAASGSAVNVISLNDAATMDAFSGLPV